MVWHEGLKNTLGQLEDLFQTHTVVGQPIHIGELTLVPFIEVVVGVAGGGIIGMGARIAPSGVLAVRGEEMKFFSMRDKSSLDQVIEIIPAILEKLPE